ncbi:MAG: hypothetical protein QM602_09720 [Microbacterium sp.]
MQLGTRWAARTEPPASVPAALRAQLAAVEAALPPDQPVPRWTLTWLEGRPVAELDTGVVVTIDRGGEVVLRHDVDDGLD